MSFEFVVPESWPETLTLLAQRGDEAFVLAGGTAFTLLLRQGLIRPAYVVSLRRVQDGARIKADAHGGLSIGATATHTDVVRSSAVRGAWPELADAVAKVATVRVRNQATLGGSVAHADPASDAPVMLAAVGPRPMRASSVEKALGSGRVDARAIDDAAALARDDVDPIDDLRGSAVYKREMARVWTARAL